jgi:hypothetical protein
MRISGVIYVSEKFYLLTISQSAYLSMFIRCSIISAVGRTSSNSSVQGVLPNVKNDLISERVSEPELEKREDLIRTIELEGEVYNCVNCHEYVAENANNPVNVRHLNLCRF